MQCKKCGAPLADGAQQCEQCGTKIIEKEVIGNVVNPGPQAVSEKSKMTAAILAFFLGWSGAHRYYVGKTGTGIAMLLTCGGVGIWTLIDFIKILMGKFTDKYGLPLK